ncbi:MAG: hypothetical protein QOA20_08100 [Nitrososphaeraceae archaeon]|nr:hypothetical protein [Nitrososphaeraceae archaeon]MDW3643521.1 hypothetical protein [Nitrososphaeraceae archaeon]
MKIDRLVDGIIITGVISLILLIKDMVILSKWVRRLTDIDLRLTYKLEVRSATQEPVMNTLNHHNL